MCSPSRVKAQYFPDNKHRHLSNEDKCFGPTGVHIEGYILTHCANVNCMRMAMLEGRNKVLQTLSLSHSLALTFFPISPFSSEDLPTLGWPTCVNVITTHTTHTPYVEGWISHLPIIPTVSTLSLTSSRIRGELVTRESGEWGGRRERERGGEGGEDMCIEKKRRGGRGGEGGEGGEMEGKWGEKEKGGKEGVCTQTYIE